MEKIINKNTAGVSLIEIMVSMVLVAIALVAITTVFPSMNKNRKGIHEADQAKMLATQVLEGLQFYSDEVNPTAGSSLCSRIGGSVNYVAPNGTAVCNGDADCVKFCNEFETAQEIGSATYTVTWKCAEVSSLNTANVRVTWNKGGKNHHIEVTGILR